VILHSKEYVVFIKELMEAEKFQAIIDRVYRFKHIFEATQYVEAAQKVGNVVITLEF
jgi:hypothetical protein